LVGCGDENCGINPVANLDWILAIFLLAETGGAGQVAERVAIALSASAENAPHITGHYDLLVQKRILQLQLSTSQRQLYQTTLFEEFFHRV
jgi:hypothetical protein